jgi:phosphatidylglycerol:prolipoprotein diacylglycerol transferase
VLTIKSYTLFTVLAALAGVLTALPLLRREGLRAKQAVPLIALMAAAFLIGARLLNAAVNPDAYGESLNLFSLKLAGLSVYGGIFGALGMLLLWARLTKRNPLPLLDALVLPSGLGFALARAGCYLNGCCAGIPPNSGWGVRFPMRGGERRRRRAFFSAARKKQRGGLLYPTQLFEMAPRAAGACPGAVAVFPQKSCRLGGDFCSTAPGFSAMRLTILPLRSLPYPEPVVRWIYPLLYMALIFDGAFTSAAGL